MSVFHTAVKRGTENKKGVGIHEGAVGAVKNYAQIRLQTLAE